MRVLRKDGSPVIGQPVQFEMTNHEFLWGSAIRETIPYVNGQLEGAEKEKIEERIEIWSKLFNNTTYPFYWGRFEPEEGKPVTWGDPAGREVAESARRHPERTPALLAYGLCRLAHAVLKRRDSAPPARPYPPRRGFL